MWEVGVEGVSGCRDSGFRRNDGFLCVRHLGESRDLSNQLPDLYRFAVALTQDDPVFDVDYSWGGVISFFRGANGFFGEVGPEIYAATTSGMPVCLLYGQQLAELALGGGSDTLDFVRQRSQPGGLPPAPILGPIARTAAALRQRRAWKEL